MGMGKLSLALNHLLPGMALACATGILKLKSIHWINFCRRASPFENGRSERIRTSGPCLPKTVLYQAELHSVPKNGLFTPRGRFCKGAI